MVSVWGAAAQGHYVAANSFLDAFAHHARAAGVPACTINWGPLTGGGMLPDEAGADLAKLGIHTTPIHDALGALDSLIGGGHTQAVVARIDWPVLRGAYEARRRRPIFEMVDAVG